MWSHGVVSRAVSFSGVRSFRVGWVSGRVGSRGVKLSGAEWSRFKSSRVKSNHGVELSAVGSTVYSSRVESSGVESRVTSSRGVLCSVVEWSRVELTVDSSQF